MSKLQIFRSRFEILKAVAAGLSGTSPACLVIAGNLGNGGATAAVASCIEPQDCLALSMPGDPVLRLVSSGRIQRYTTPGALACPQPQRAAPLLAFDAAPRTHRGGRRSRVVGHSPRRPPLSFSTSISFALSLLKCGLDRSTQAQAPHWRIHARSIDDTAKDRPVIDIQPARHLLLHGSRKMLRHDAHVRAGVLRRPAQ